MEIHVRLNSPAAHPELELGDRPGIQKHLADWFWRIAYLPLVLSTGKCFWPPFRGPLGCVLVFLMRTPALALVVLVFPLPTKKKASSPPRNFLLIPNQGQGDSKTQLNTPGHLPRQWALGGPARRKTKRKSEALGFELVFRLAQALATVGPANTKLWKFQRFCKGVLTSPVK